MRYALRNLSVAIAGQPLVHGIDLSVAPGECTAIIGASGSGKSLLSFAPLGMGPRGAQVSGSAQLDGQELLTLAPDALRHLRAQSVGFVYQQPLTALSPHRTVAQHLAEAAMQAGGPRPSAAALAAMLDAVGLRDGAAKLRRYPHQLSGGERQRVVIAMGIAHRPKLLIADEPTSALDAALRGEIMALLATLCRERQMALLLVSHDLAAVARDADRLIVLDQGRLVEAGAAAPILAAPQADYTRALVAAIPQLAPLAAPPVTEPTGESGLSVRGASVHFTAPGWFRPPVAALADVDMSLPRGQGLAIVGGSGSGKSTLGRAIAGLGPLTTGEICWHGEKLPPRRHRRTAHRALVQPVFQDPVASLDPLWAVGAVVAEPMSALRPDIAPDLREDAVQALLTQVGLDPLLADRRAGTLSGGQAQRVAIARALAAKPELLLLDEATSALDPLIAAEILVLLKELQVSHGLTLVMITHDLASASILCQQLLVLDAGRVVEAGAMAQVIAAPQHAVTKALIAATRA